MPIIKIEPARLNELAARLLDNTTGEDFTADEAMKDAAAELRRLAVLFEQLGTTGLNIAAELANLEAACPCPRCTAAREARSGAHGQANQRVH